MSYASMIVAFVTAHPNLAYGIVFALAFSEAVPLLGAIVPGSAIMLA